MAHTLFSGCFNSLTVTFLLIPLAVTGVAQAAARVEVIFVQPEKFTDVGNDYSPTNSQRDALLAQLRQHLEQKATRYVHEGGKLTISIKDVDMAGGFEPWRGPSLANIRIVKDIYPPRIVLDFRLTAADGKMLVEGGRKLSDLAFQTSVGNRNDTLRHEKKLLDDWLGREFSRRSAN